MPIYTGGNSQWITLRDKHRIAALRLPHAFRRLGFGDGHEPDRGGIAAGARASPGFYAEPAARRPLAGSVQLAITA